MQNNSHYFLGTSTGSGFWGCFSQLTGGTPRPYLIKAGPGCGKSTLMRKLGRQAEQLGCRVEYIHCGSDPASLDGVLCEELNFVVLDATAPHAIHPALPGAVQQLVSLYDCMDSDKLLQNGETLERLSARYGGMQQRTRRFFAAAAALYEDAMRLMQSALLREKLNRYLAGLCSRQLPPTGRRGSEQLRLCTNFTPDGFVDYRAHNFAACRRIVFCDRFGAVSAQALQTVRERALASGYRTVVCLDPLAPTTRLTAVFLPELNLCFLADGAFGAAPRKGAQLVHAARFYDSAQRKLQSGRANFSLRAAKLVLEQACSQMEQARQLHTEMERFYVQAVDFAAVDRRREELFAAILRRAGR